MGSGDSFGAGGSPTFDRMPILTGGQTALLGELNKIVSKSLGRGIKPYRGDLAAGASPLQNWAFEQIMGLGSGPDAELRQAALRRMISGQPAYEASPEEYERIYRQGVEAPALRQFHEDLVPQLQHQFGGSRSGTFIDQLAKATGGLTTDLAAERAKYRFLGQQRMEDALTGAADRSLGAIQLGATEETRPLRYALAGGEMQRNIAQDKLTEKYLKWQMSKPWANPWLQHIPQVMGTPGFSPVTVGGQYSPSGAGAGLAGLGNILQGGLWS